MDCRTALEILDCQGLGVADLPSEDLPGSEMPGVNPPKADLAAAEAHLAGCASCRAIVRKRRKLDRKIGRALRAVNVPRDSRERLIAQLVTLEAAAAAPAAVENGRNEPESDRQIAAISKEAVVPKITRRSWLRMLVPIAACVAVAAIGFFSVVWLLTPRWSIDDVSQQLARLDFESLDALKRFDGPTAAAHLPSEPGWQKLDWRAGEIPKALTDAANGHPLAVYGFVVPIRHRQPIRGLLAVVPRRLLRAPPPAESLSTAPSNGYVAARIGDSVSVAWSEGDVTYVCLVEGGEDSLAALRQVLGASAA